MIILSLFGPIVQPGITFAPLTLVSYSVTARLAVCAHVGVGSPTGLKTPQLRKWMFLCVFIPAQPPRWFSLFVCE